MQSDKNKQSDKNNTILVPSDFTQIGDYAVDNAVKLAKDLNFSICVLHVINKETKKNLEKQNKTIEYVDEQLASITDGVKKDHNIEASYISREGSIFSVIAEVADEIMANYVVIGTHGKKGLQFLVGSFALKVIKSSPVPVFVVQGPPENSDVQNIVFPLNLDPGSKQKVKWAIIMNEQFNANFHLYIDNQSDEFSQNRIKGDLKQVKKILEKHNISYTETFSEKKIPYSQQLVDYAKNIKSSFIMISTDPDKTSINPFGSHDERIIYNQEKLPVMCINSQDLKVLIGGL